jgi:hypothetical protein
MLTRWQCHDIYDDVLELFNDAKRPRIRFTQYDLCKVFDLILLEIVIY